MHFDLNTSKVLYQHDGSGNSFSANIQVSDGIETIHQFWDVAILDNGIDSPARLKHEFKTDTILNFGEGQVDVTDMKINDGIEVKVKCSTLEADAFEIDGMFEIEIE